MGGYGGSRANAANLCSCRCFALYKKTEFITGATPESQELHTREGCGPLEHKPGCPRIFAQFATARRKRGHLTADLRPDKVLTMDKTTTQDFPRVTQHQFEWLRVVAAAKGKGCSNWSGSPYNTLDQLIAKGLVHVKRQSEFGRSQWDTYSVTNKGREFIDAVKGAGLVFRFFQEAA